MKLTFKNRDILELTLHALTGEILYKIDNKQQLDIHLRIDDRDIRITANSDNTKYDIYDTDTGEVIAIQPLEDFLVEVDKEWLNKDSEIYYNL